MIDTEQAVELGREVVVDGRLKALRKELGLTKNAMAELLHTTWPTYSDWEKRPVVLRLRTAERVGRFYQAATLELAALREQGVDLSNLVPFHVLGVLLGVPQEQLLHRYRTEKIEAMDLGILGLWVKKTEVTRLRQR